MVVPHIEVVRVGEELDAFTVGAQAPLDGVMHLSGLDAVGSSTYLDRDGETLDIPLPGAARGLVEVVDVEDKAARG